MAVAFEADHSKRRWVWRALEVGVAAATLVAAAPLCVLIALAILVEDGHGVLFTQERVGLHGRRFRILKFRTMRSAGAAPAVPLAQPDHHHPLVTRVGRLLRRSHLDELPQLVNVIVGDMSLVGPRPLVPEEDALVARDWEERHLHRPGLTGVWQLHRSPQTTVEELIGLDQRCIAESSPWRDLHLLVVTARRALPPWDGKRT